MSVRVKKSADTRPTVVSEAAVRRALKEVFSHGEMCGTLAMNYLRGPRAGLQAALAWGSVKARLGVVGDAVLAKD